MTKHIHITKRKKRKEERNSKERQEGKLKMKNEIVQNEEVKEGRRIGNMTEHTYSPQRKRESRKKGIPKEGRKEE